MTDSYSVVRDIVELLRNAVTNFDDEIITTEKHDIWSVKKLVALYSYIKPYCEIMRKNGFEKLHYIDLFSGSGLLRINDKIMPGTPLIPLIRINDGYKFDSYTLADIKKQYVDVLKTRSTKLLGKNKLVLNVIKTNFDEVVVKLFTGISPPRGEYKKNGYLVVLDPYGMQVSWKQLERILQSGSVDMFITFMTWAHKWNLTKGQSYKKMTSVYGDESWSTCKNSDELVDRYCRKIRLIPTSWQPYRTTEVAVESFGGHIYHLIFVSKSAGAHNSFGWIQEHIDQVNKDLLEDAFRGGTVAGSDLDYYTRKQPS